MIGVQQAKWRWTMRCTGAGVLLAGLIAAGFVAGLRHGMTAAQAGYGPGILAWFASAPFGLILLNAIVFPVMRELGLHDPAPMRNMTVILAIGVVANWALIGVAVDAIRWLGRRSPLHSS
jgi:hypothetical protein